jgi:serine/threonine protein kinase
MKVPEVIGRYEIIDELGRGAMGSVFKARDPAVGRIVALKTIHSTALEGSQSDEYRARFYREARASGVLAHPGIVPVFDVGEHQGAPFLVMEFVDGRTLADAIKKGQRFTLDHVCEIGQQIAEALGYAHRQGVIHRDIKPANILLTSREVYGSERPRITDFGIAKLVANEITTTGQLLGTPSFMPPEQFTGAPVDGRADLFSLGVILYSLATGEQPFPGETMTAVSYKVVHTEPIPPSKLNPAVTARLERIILKCLAKNPAERYQTGEEIAQELAALRTGTGTGALQSSSAANRLESDATLGPATMAIPSSTQAQRSATSGAASSQGTNKRPSKRVPFETVFAVVLLAVAGLVVASATTWYLFAHAFRALHHTSASATQSSAPLPPPAPAPQPATSQPAAAQPSAALPAPPAPEPQQPIETQPQTPAPAANKSLAAPPAATKSASTKTQVAKSAVAKVTPSALTPAEPVPAVTKPEPAPSPSVGTPNETTPANSLPASHPSARVAFDPRKLSPDTNAKLRIDMEHFPFGVPYTVEMNGKVYLRGITGENTDLDNLFVPPGTQEFRLTMRSGGQQKVSNIVSDEFKAKKRKTLRVELRGQESTPASSAEPISSGAQIFLSLK